MFLDLFYFCFLKLVAAGLLASWKGGLAELKICSFCEILLSVQIVCKVSAKFKFILYEDKSIHQSQPPTILLLDTLATYLKQLWKKKKKNINRDNLVIYYKFAVQLLTTYSLSVISDIMMMRPLNKNSPTISFFL